MFDPGLQPERTALAWRRTALALTVASVVGARLLGPVLGGVAVVAGASGLVASAALLVVAARRGRRVDASLHEHGDLSGGPGGAELVLVALACASAGAVALAGLVLRTLP